MPCLCPQRGQHFRAQRGMLELGAHRPPAAAWGARPLTGNPTLTGLNAFAQHGRGNGMWP